ncbi:NUDIX domain-containing protein, partial [Alphaproteobacteria bacterium]|nr:NUDIX domain-containing protein [Alphaproteobacteria bacterium]
KNLFFNETNKKKLNHTLKNTCELLLEKKVISSVTGENFSCVTSFGKKELFVLERSLVEYLGIRGYGVHLVGYVKTKRNNIKIWTPLRSPNKRVEPNKLDNTIAGGVSAGETIHEALKREGYEEASLKSNVLNNAFQAGTINYVWRNKEFSLRRDTLFLFDLELNSDIVPYNNDGELSSYSLLHSKKVIEKIKNTNEFKKNCALVLISFFIRRGLINSKNEKNYEEICNFL